MAEHDLVRVAEMITALGLIANNENDEIAIELTVLSKLAGRFPDLRGARHYAPAKGTRVSVNQPMQGPSACHVALRTRQDGRKVYCLDVKLVA